MTDIDRTDHIASERKIITCNGLLVTETLTPLSVNEEAKRNAEELLRELAEKYTERS